MSASNVHTAVPKPEPAVQAHAEPGRRGLVNRTADTAGATGLPSAARCACGGGCPRCSGTAGTPGAPQTKLWVTSAHDPLEREADQAADAALAGRPTALTRSVGVVARACACGGSAGACSCDTEDDCEVQLQRADAAGNSARQAPLVVQDVLGSAGRPLEPQARAFMEKRFEHDFSDVEVHTDGAAAASAHAVAARAYTSGRHIVFAFAQYAPGTSAGRRLLAHELAHVVQQSGRAGPPGHRQRARPSLARAPPPDGAVMRQAAPAPAATPAVPAAPPSAASATGLACVRDTTPGVTGTPVLFPISGSTLAPADLVTLDGLAGSWHSGGRPGGPVNVHGYASTDGSTASNLRLSCARAEAVAAALAAPSDPRLAGVPRASISLFMHGETTEFGAVLTSNRRTMVEAIVPGAPVCSTAPPGCPIGTTLAPLLRDPGIPGRGQCRAACGRDCPSTCAPLPDVTTCVPDATGACHFTCEYVNVISCGTHAGCRVHDACYDACEAAGKPFSMSPFATCHRGCDVGCVSAHSISLCNSWRTGGGPFTSRLEFSDPPISAGPFPGACRP